MTAVTTDLIAESSDAAGDHTVYRGSRLRHVAMPLGGVGAGHIALGGDGGLRQWQIHNQVNHRGFVPDSFFAIRAASIEPPLNVIRLLQSREVTDDDIPEDQRRLVELFTGVERTEFSAAYPFARIRYFDDVLPLEISLEAH